MKKLITRITASLGYLLGALGLEEETPRNIYDPKPWRDTCHEAETDEAEEAAGVPVEDRISCGEMQRAAIQVVVTTYTVGLKQGDRNAGKE